MVARSVVVFILLIACGFYGIDSLTCNAGQLKLESFNLTDLPTAEGTKECPGVCSASLCVNGSNKYFVEGCREDFFESDCGVKKAAWLFIGKLVDDCYMFNNGFINYACSKSNCRANLFGCMIYTNSTRRVSFMSAFKDEIKLPKYEVIPYENPAPGHICNYGQLKLPTFDLTDLPPANKTKRCSGTCSASICFASDDKYLVEGCLEDFYKSDCEITEASWPLMGEIWDDCYLEKSLFVHYACSKPDCRENLYGCLKYDNSTAKVSTIVEVFGAELKLPENQIVVYEPKTTTTLAPTTTSMARTTSGTLKTSPYAAGNKDGFDLEDDDYLDESSSASTVWLSVAVLIMIHAIL